MKQHFKPIALLSVTLAIAGMAGCAEQPIIKPTGPTMQEKELAASVKQIDAVTSNLRTAPKPYAGFPIPEPATVKTSDGLNRLITIDVKGSAATALSKVAAASGMRFDNQHRGPVWMVEISAKNQRTSDVLSAIAAELPPSAVVHVEAGVITLKDQ